ncbi:MAG: hypothetical protein WC107_01550 [Patescibacteria group bacterium]
MKNNIDLSTQLIVEEAVSRNIAAVRLGERDIFELKLGSHTDYVCDQSLSSFGLIARACCANKETTKYCLNRAGIAIAEGDIFASGQIEEALIYAKEIGWPVVIKPSNSKFGNSVFLDINSADDFIDSFQKCVKNFDKIIVEKYVEGTEYRILATREKVAAITKRVPANVIGDGLKTLSELIKEKNNDLRRKEKKGLFPIVIDEVAKRSFERKSILLETVPEKGKQIFLRDNSNLSTGGDSIDFTDMAHPSVKEIAVRVIKSIPGLLYGGVDFLTKDITKFQTDDSYIIVEVNSSPMISMHHYPYKGKPRNVAKEIIDIAFPETKEKK